MYKILENRFPSDIKIWMTHIDFLKRMVRYYRGPCQLRIYKTLISP